MSRLEEKGRKFRSFLDRLRHARDEAGFDDFMAERRRRSATTGLSGNGPPEPAANPG